MLPRRTLCWLGLTVFEFALVGLGTGQNATPATRGPAQSTSTLPAPPVAVNVLIDSAIRQERRLIVLMRNFKPIIETYIQEYSGKESTGKESPGKSFKSDDYFLSRLDLTGNAPVTAAFADPEGTRESWEKRLLPARQTFTAAGFAQPIFPDQNHFDRENYTFEFVRWEILGDVHCGVVDVKPLENAENRGFIGRIWIEDQDFNIVRFTGTYTSKSLSKRSFHFDSWRLNTLSIMWMPAYIYTQESASPDPANHDHANHDRANHDRANHDRASNDLWFKAQTRIWGYDRQQAGDHREFAKRLTDIPEWVDPKQHEASQDLSPANTLGETTYTSEDNLVERLQVAGLMAPDGEVDHVLQTVVNNLLLTNNLYLPAVRCRVLLTTPLESFVVGRTIILSRGLLDVLPDEATLAAVLAHELAHIVLHHSVADELSSGFAVPFSDLEIFDHFDFHFDLSEEADADKKGLELFSNSPYKAQLANAELFLKALKARSTQLANLLHGRFSNDFVSSHLLQMQSLSQIPKPLQTDRPETDRPEMDRPGTDRPEVHRRETDRPENDRLDQTAALPLGSRIKLDPWSDRIEMLKSQPARPLSAAEKMPLELSPFFPYLKRLNENQKAQNATHP
jgi:hypothetical protein